MLDIFDAVEKDESLFHFHENPNPECPVGKTVHAVLDKRLLSIQKAMHDQMRSTLTKELRGSGCTIPLLMVTARVAPEDRKQGFRLRVDDYMTKPVDEEELLLRIAALLRRSRIAAERKLTVGGTELLYDSFTVLWDGRAAELPPKEFLLLYKLLSYNNKIFTRQQLRDEIWDLDSDSGEHTVNVHINRLRERFRGNEDFEIVTVRGLGYKAVRLA